MLKIICRQFCQNVETIKQNECLLNQHDLILFCVYVVLIYSFIYSIIDLLLYGNFKLLTSIVIFLIEAKANRSLTIPFTM